MMHMQFDRELGSIPEQCSVSANQLWPFLTAVWVFWGGGGGNNLHEKIKFCNLNQGFCGSQYTKVLQKVSALFFCNYLLRTSKANCITFL
jgi:hypothetical protein